ncbi:uncharacterized protein K444DRAFT_160254 [Hyaloscypha bicolor E]|uniref:Uncharacterized protein n=1 Tax=Hyaloscypha bicolor E TaxID=1095630 RepID=A0A2J6TSK5_9HELO|nr:uncharacterized protein K444DRAFT_160254 [Hyaloscypha bicolor E]PMD66006.1 hypothetical protein K444DRAFT_160254 [Hyaloscypha bicolor E]
MPVPIPDLGIRDVVIRISEAVPIVPLIAVKLPDEGEGFAGPVEAAVGAQDLGGVLTLAVEAGQIAVAVDVVPGYVAPGAGMPIEEGVDG